MYAWESWKIKISYEKSLIRKVRFVCKRSKSSCWLLANSFRIHELFGLLDHGFIRMRS